MARVLFRAPQRVTTTPTYSQLAKREFVLFAACLAFGLLLLPAAIYLVGQAIFGDYGGDGIGQFYGGLASRIRDGDLVVWFLVLSPYLFLQILRITFRLFRRLGH